MNWWSPRALAAGLACLVLASCGGGSPPAGATPSATATRPANGSAPSALSDPTDLEVNTPEAGSAPVDGRPWYLAVGDSITYGFTRDPARAGVNSAWPLLMQPMLAQAGRPWSLFDVACPSETTASYFAGCPVGALLPFLAARSQHDVATAAVRAHRADLRLVLVDLGSNDLLRGLRSGADQAAVVRQLLDNLDRVVTELQQLAPGVPVAVANFYDPLAEAAPATVPQLRLINAQVAALARRHGAAVADFFGAINGGGRALCSLVDCARNDVHPTVAGQQALARAGLSASLAASPSPTASGLRSPSA